MSHTPGPWSVRIRSAYTGNYIVLEAGPAEDADNARLIAAAPEMLALLRNVLDLTAAITGTSMRRKSGSEST